MKPLACESVCVSSFMINTFISILCISEDRISDRSEMYSYLMSTPSEEIYFEKSIFISKISFIDKFCFSDFWIERILYGHFFAIIWISADEGFDISFMVFHLSYNKSEVGLLYRTLCYLLLESVHRCIIFRYDDNSTCIFIKTMDDSWSFYSIYY